MPEKLWFPSNSKNICSARVCIILEVGLDLKHWLKCFSLYFEYVIFIRFYDVLWPVLVPSYSKPWIIDSGLELLPITTPNASRVESRRSVNCWCNLWDVVAVTAMRHVYGTCLLNLSLTKYSILFVFKYGVISRKWGFMLGLWNWVLENCYRHPRIFISIFTNRLLVIFKINTSFILDG